jgi:hypothetical protein
MWAAVIARSEFPIDRRPSRRGPPRGRVDETWRIGPGGGEDCCLEARLSGKSRLARCGGGNLQ